MADNHPMDADLFVDGPVAPRRDLRAVLRDGWVRWRPSRWLGTLKARLAFGMMAGLLLGMSVTAWQLTARAEADLLRQAQLREQGESQRAALVVAGRLAALTRALARVGERIDLDTMADHAALRRLVEQQQPWPDGFSRVAVADDTGRELLPAGDGAARAPALAAQDRDALRQALRERRPRVSVDVARSPTGPPALTIVWPQPLADGRVVAVVGAVDLPGEDLLDLLGLRPEAAARGSTDDGTLLVLSDDRGRILSHPRRGRLLAPLEEEPRLAGARRHWAATGAAGAGGFVPRGGVDGDIVAWATEPMTGWQVWRAVSEAQFLAALREARAMALRDAALLAAGIAVGLVTFLAWQLRPLARLERRAAAMLTGDTSGEWPEADGEIGRLVRTLRHVWAERTQVESFNAEVLRKLGSVMDAAPVGLAFAREQRFELVSTELCRLIGSPAQDLVGRPTQSIFVSNEDYAAFGRELAAAFDRRQPYGGEWALLRADGTRFWGLLRARPVTPGDAGGGTIWSVTDVSDQVEARRALEYAAHHDGLTGVVNRQGFDRALQAAFDGQPGTRPTSLVVIDLDHFKPINDAAGHAAGDAMLVAVAQAIASRVRGSDVVVRLGGDEFALLLPHCDQARALAVAEKVREAITGLSLTWEAHTLRVGASLGVAELSPRHESAAQWLAQADAACYDAKRAGRGTVRGLRGALRAVPGG